MKKVKLNRGQFKTWLDDLHRVPGRAVDGYFAIAYAIVYLADTIEDTLKEKEKKYHRTFC